MESSQAVWKSVFSAGGFSLVLGGYIAAHGDAHSIGGIIQIICGIGLAAAGVIGVVVFWRNC